MKFSYKPLLAISMLALPLAAVQAQGSNATQPTGEGADGSIPAETSTPPSPPMTMPAPTETDTGEGEESSEPGTDQPLSTTKPADINSPSADTTTRPSTEPGTAQQTAPSQEQPPRGAPMRTGPDSQSTEGSSTISGSDANTTNTQKNK